MKRLERPSFSKESWAFVLRYIERNPVRAGMVEATQQGKAWGRTAFLERLGNKLNRVIVPRKRGRPKKVDK